MSEGVFVIRNQTGHYWTRSGEWADGREPQRLLKLKHRDEAVNQLVELSARDVDLRGEVLACELNAKKDPEIEVSNRLTPTLAEKAATAAALAAEQDSEATADVDEAPLAEAENDADNEGEPPVSAAV